MINYKLQYFKRTALVNYLLIIIYITISITAHLIANRLITIFNKPFISATFIYTAVFVINDILASYNNKKFVIFIILTEASVNLFVISFTNLITHLPHPAFFQLAKAYNIVFGAVLPLYFANLLGTMVAAVIDLIFFYYLYKNKGWSFFASSFTSSVVTLFFYTTITDYFWFEVSYPSHMLNLTIVNLAANFMNLAIYSSIGQIAVFLIQKYLNKGFNIQ